jgi:O-antigen/teichoic acid export membrane protein
MHFLAPVLSRYASIFVQFALAAVVTNSLSLHDAGLYFTISGLILTTYFISGFGLPDGAVKTVPVLIENGAIKRAAAVLCQTHFIGISSAIVIAILFGFVCFSFTGSAEIGLFSGVWWLGYGSVFVGAQILVAQGSIRFGAFAFYSAVNCGIIIFLLPIVMLFKVVTFEVILLGSCSAAMLAALVVVLVVGQNGAWPRRPVRRGVSDLVAAWQQGVAISAARVLQAMIIWSPVWIAQVFVSPEDAALLGLASRLTAAVAAVLAAVRFSIRPDLARLSAKNKWHQICTVASNIAFWTTALAVLAIVGDILVGRILISVFFGDRYVIAQILVAIMLLGTLGESIGGPVDEVLKMAGMASFVFFAQATTLILGIALQVAGGIIFGSSGIALAYAVMVSGFYFVLIWKLHARHGIFVIARIPWGRTIR